MHARTRPSHVFFGVLAALAVTLAAWGPAAFVHLAYHRSRVLEGEAWRLATTHLVHAGSAHLALNLAGLGLVWAAFGARLRALAWLACALAAALASSVGVLVAQPRVQVMAGMSGVLHGLLAAGAVSEARRGSVLGRVLLAGLAVKLAWDLAAPPWASFFLGAPVAAGAHLFGAAAGALCAWPVCSAPAPAQAR